MDFGGFFAKYLPAFKLTVDFLFLNKKAFPNKFPNKTWHVVHTFVYNRVFGE